MEISQQFTTHAETVKIEFFQSPFLLCSQHVEYKSYNFSQDEINRMIDKCDSEEYDLLEKLIHVPKNKLQRFADKVCSFKEIRPVQKQIENNWYVKPIFYCFSHSTQPHKISKIDRQLVCWFCQHYYIACIIYQVIEL